MVEQTELYSLSRLIIERVFPKGTVMTPEYLIDVLKRKF